MSKVKRLEKELEKVRAERDRAQLVALGYAGIAVDEGCADYREFGPDVDAPDYLRLHPKSREAEWFRRAIKRSRGFDGDADISDEDLFKDEEEWDDE